MSGAQHQALYQRLIESPWDSALREVWGDAAMEAGLPLGHYAALERARLAGSERFEQRLAREALFDTHHRDWAAPVLALLPEVAVGSAAAASPWRLALDSGYRLGVPGMLGLPDLDPRLVPRVLDAAPITGLAALIDGKAHLRALAEGGHGGRLTHFAPLLGDSLSKEDWRAYADAGGLTRLEALELWSFPAGLPLLLSRAEKLTALSLPGTMRGAPGGHGALLGSARLAQLQVLALSAGVADAALEGLLARRGLRLTTLELTRAQLQRPTFPGLLAAAVGATLESLNLSGSQVSLPALARALPSFQRLRALDLSLPGAGNAQNALAELLPALDRGRLRQLRLCAHELNARAIGALVNHGPWLKLEQLDLTDSRLAPDAALALFQSDAFPALRHLVLSGVRLDTQSARALAGAKAMAQLEELELSRALQAEGLLAFAGAVRAPRLRRLKVPNAGCSPRELATLFALEGAPHLGEVAFDAPMEGPSLSLLLAGAAPTLTRFCGPAAEGEVVAFMASARAAGFRRLELLGLHWSQRAVEATCASPHLGQLGLLHARGSWAEEQRSALVRHLGHRVTFEPSATAPSSRRLVTMG